jgi:hypothetical protein
MMKTVGLPRMLRVRSGAPAALLRAASAPWESSSSSAAAPATSTTLKTAAPTTTSAAASAAAAAPLPERLDGRKRNRHHEYADKVRLHALDSIHSRQDG